MTRKQKINVMHVILDLVPGGAERVVLNYLKFHDRKRFTPMVCVLRHLADAERWELNQGSIDYFFIDKGDGFKLKAIFKLFGFLRNHRIDVLHLHNFSAIMYGTIAGLLANTEVIIQTEHNVVNRTFSIQRKIKGYLKCLFGLFSQKIIAVSDQVKESQRNHNFFARNKFVTIHNGINISSFEKISDVNSLKEELKIGGKNVVVTKIASLITQKGHEVLIDAAEIVTKKVKNVKFLIVGDGPRKENLLRLVNEKELKNFFIFSGIRNDVPKLLNITDIFVLSSHWEGFPMTILEAMASGKAAIVTDVGGNREAVVHAETGYLVKKGDSLAIANAIIELALDKNMRTAMGKAGKDRLLNNFTAEVMVQKTEKEYLKSLGLF